MSILSHVLGMILKRKRYILSFNRTEAILSYPFLQPVRQLSLLWGYRLLQILISKFSELTRPLYHLLNETLTCPSATITWDQTFLLTTQVPSNNSRMCLLELLLWNCSLTPTFPVCHWGKGYFPWNSNLFNRTFAKSVETSARSYI